MNKEEIIAALDMVQDKLIEECNYLLSHPELECLFYPYSSTIEALAKKESELLGVASSMEGVLNEYFTSSEKLKIQHKKMFELYRKAKEQYSKVVPPPAEEGQRKMCGATFTDANVMIADASVVEGEPELKFEDFSQWPKILVIKAKTEGNSKPTHAAHRFCVPSGTVVVFNTDKCSYCKNVAEGKSFLLSNFTGEVSIMRNTFNTLAQETKNKPCWVKYEENFVQIRGKLAEEDVFMLTYKDFTV